MRAVKSVIIAAGNLKREQKDLEENQICLRALKNVNVPKFLKDDLKLFNGKLVQILKFLKIRNPFLNNINVEFKNLFILKLYNFYNGLLNLQFYILF